MDRKEKWCDTCHGYTMHDWVKNFYTHYWRCEECVTAALLLGDIFVPGYYRGQNKHRKKSGI